MVVESEMAGGRTRALPIKLDLEMDYGDSKIETELKDHQDGYGESSHGCLARRKNHHIDVLLNIAQTVPSADK